MTMLRWPTLVPLLISAIIMVGCAKRPATTQASAPAPLGAAGAGARTAGDAGQSSGASAEDGTGAADGARSALSGDAADGSDAGSAQAGTGAGGDRGSAATGTAATGAGERGAGAGRDGGDGDSTRADTRAGRDAPGGSDSRAVDARGGAAGESGDGAAGAGSAQGSNDGTSSQIASAAGPGGTAPGDGASGAMMAAARPEVLEFVSIPDLGDVHFDFDRYDIRPEDARVLDANAEWLKANPDRLLLIEGHCDERGTNEYNLALGEHRAKSAMNYLISQGVQSSRMTIISYGEERPACTDKSEPCWSANRRAHFLVKSR